MPLNEPYLLLDVARMAQADQRTIAAGTPGTELMQRAGAAVAREIIRRWTPRPVAVLCGPGNNGGDGYVVASLLAAQGWPVRVAALCPSASLPDDARHHAESWGDDVLPLEPLALEGAALVVDALFGAGLARPLHGAAARTLAAARAAGLPIVAIDIPSGVMGDSGEDLGAVGAALTVTFVRRKPGHLLMPGRTLCGEVVVADIGIGEATVASLGGNTWENVPQAWRDALPLLAPDTHKYRRGHALVFGGYPMTGAARLAAMAAARAGAGLVTVAVPPEGFAIYAASLLSIMVKPCADGQALSALLEDERHGACLLGPGAGPGPQTRRIVLAALATGRPCVLDAGALTAFRYEPHTLMQAIAGPCVLTPHEGEFARLFDAGGSKLARARLAAAQSGAVVLLKGADTVVAAPDGRAAINANAPATLATAGAGDVLAGLITGLLAQGMDAWTAACAAAWIHGEAAAAYGPGLIADDLPGLLPGVLARLGAPAGAAHQGPVQG
ncbi:NAD(P)H-hydrate dehydratase [Orrella sp. JC864]|uniref:NAD(P)H-hydrate dehydratase n=1 Tax=Orrella sp. JC864 TaxID=3120298 RepID=UPI003009DBF0